MAESLKVFLLSRIILILFFEDQREIGKMISVRSSSPLKQCHLLLAVM